MRSAQPPETTSGLTDQSYMPDQTTGSKVCITKHYRADFDLHGMLLVGWIIDPAHYRADFDLRGMLLVGWIIDTAHYRACFDLRGILLVGWIIDPAQQSSTPTKLPSM